MSCLDRKLGHKLSSETKSMVGPSGLRLLSIIFKGTTSTCKRMYLFLLTKEK